MRNPSGASNNACSEAVEKLALLELWLKIFPVTLGKGKKLFDQGTKPAAYKLISSKTTPSGILVANYRRDGEVKTGSFN